MMDEEDKHSPTTFIILRIWKLLNRDWNRYHQKTVNDFINQQKIENTNRKTATDTDNKHFFLWGGGGGGGGSMV